MIIKILKGRSFGGLLDYLFEPQNKPPPTEIEVGGSPKDRGSNEELLFAREFDGAEAIEKRLFDDFAGVSRKGELCEIEDAKRAQRGEILISNMAGRSKEELREHFEALAALRPDVQVNVLHGILSMPEEDVLSLTKKARIVLRFVELKGLDWTMYAAIEHEEEGHKHTEIHLASSTINFKGKLPSDSFDYDKGESIARQLEKEFNLKPNKSSRDSMERAPTQGEWKQHERTGKLSRPLRLQALVNSSLDREVTFTEFQEGLERRGVMLRLFINDEGKVVGSVYKFEGKHIRGRRLGRGFTWQGLQRNWPDQQERKGRMTYDAERDNEAFSRAGSSTVARGRGATELGERPSRSTIGDKPANQRAGRKAGANRESSRQTSAVSEEGRGTVRNNSTRREGVARRDSGTSQAHRYKSQSVQRASDDERGTNQRRVSAPAQNSSGLLRRDAEDKRQKRGDGRTMPGYGGDEQRYLQQGQRGSAGSVGENTISSEGHGRSTSQRDRGAGAALQDGLQATKQVNSNWHDTNPPERVRRWNDGERDVVLHEAAPNRRNGSLDSAKDSESEKDDRDHQRTVPNALSTDSGSSISHPFSAVDQVIGTLWDSSSLLENLANQSTGSPSQENRTEKVCGKQPKETKLVEMSRRDEISSNLGVQSEIVKDQTDSLLSQRDSQEKQVGRTGRNSSGGHGHSK